jgi:uncharacterized RDD family membrane protein YckC
MEIATFSVTPDMLATASVRFINYVIDTIIQYTLIFGLALLVGFLGELVGSGGILDWLSDLSGIGEYLLGAIIMLSYYMLLETYLSQTVGKFVTRTIVVMEDGSKPGAGTILKRTLCRLIPFDGLTFLSSGRGWHDTIPNTYVVKKHAFEKNRELFYAFDEIGAAE